jgi:hypothetical protein
MRYRTVKLLEEAGIVGQTDRWSGSPSGGR